MRDRTNLRPQDILKLGKPCAIDDAFIVVACTHTFKPPTSDRDVTAVVLRAFLPTARGLFDAIGRLRPMAFNARPGTIGHEAKLWVAELLAESRQERAA